MPTLPDLQWVLALIAIVTGAVAIVKLVPPAVVTTMAFGRRVAVWMIPTAVKNHYAGLQRTIGAVARIEGEISEIKKELTTNGGSTLKDHVMLVAARQSAIFESMQRPAFHADGAGAFASVNRAFERLTGYSAKDLLGMGWVNLLHQDDLDRFMVAYQHAIRDQRMLRWTCRIVTADGRELEVCIDAAPMRAPDGRRGTVMGWYGTLDSEPTI